MKSQALYCTVPQPADPALDNSLGYRDGVLYVVGSVAPDAEKGIDETMGYISGVNATDGAWPCLHACHDGPQVLCWSKF